MLNIGERKRNLMLMYLNLSRIDIWNKGNCEVVQLIECWNLEEYLGFLRYFIDEGIEFLYGETI